MVSQVALRPNEDFLIVAVDSDGEKVSKGGIVLPDRRKSSSYSGKVVAAGPGRRADDGTLIEMPAQEGDRVLFGDFSRVDVEADGEMLCFVRARELFAVWK